MASPAPDPPPTIATAVSPTLPEPPAETLADFRPVAERSHALLTHSAGAEHAALRAAYTSFVTAINAAASDAHLAELGNALAAEYQRAH
jgi:hypothetical protein